MSKFNLIDEPWIPCIDMTNRKRNFGIRDAFINSHKLQEVHDNSPLMTLSIHRLLLAILYRAWEGPHNNVEWRELYKKGQIEASTLDKYLEKWYERFFLFDNNYPFYQMGNFETDKSVSVTRLANELASGNNPTLFDHSNDELDCAWPFDVAARNLITCQSFALGFGKSSKAIINNIAEEIPYSSDGIAIRGMSIWLQGDNLFETLLINLSTIDKDSSPPWEMDDTNKYRDKLLGKDKTTFPSFGIVDRLTWQSRLIKLIPEGKKVSKMYFTQGRSADKSSGDFMKSYISDKKEGIKALSLSAGKAAWRDSHTIFFLPSENPDEQRPKCFNLLDNAREYGVINDDKSFTTNIVGLASAPGKAGKFVLWRHEKLPVPAALLTNDDLIERLGTLLNNAEIASSYLRKRIREIAKAYLEPRPNATEKQSNKADVDQLADSLDSRPGFWANMENHFLTLLFSLADDKENASISWRKNIKLEAQKALEKSINSLGTTARALRATAHIRKNFTDSDIGLKE